MTTEGSNSPLTRADVGRLLSQVESSDRLDLSHQNLQHIDLSYLDLQGANLCGADLQGAYLRGTNLSETDLREANLSGADLDGADLSYAHVGERETNHVKLQHAKLSHATLRGLDLRGFDLRELDLRNADLNGSDLCDAMLYGADVSGADLSTAHLHGPELRGAILHHHKLPDDRLKQTHPHRTSWQKLAPVQPKLIHERTSLPQEQEARQSKQRLSDREAYILGEQALLSGSDPVRIRQLFPQEFNFVVARQLFDAWLLQSGDVYSEQEINAMWIGFAHQIYDLYHYV